MNTLRASLALACTMAALAVLLVVAGQKHVVPLDPRLGAVEVWQRSQAAMAALTGYTATEIDTFSYTNGSRTTSVSRMTVDRQTGSGLLTSKASRAGPPSPPLPAPDLPADVLAQHVETIARVNRDLGIVPGEAVTSMELYYTSHVERGFVRTNGRDWKELADDVFQRFGFANEFKPSYRTDPTPKDLVLAGIASFNGKPVYHLTWANDVGRGFEALVDGDFHILDTVALTPINPRPNSPSGDTLRQETRYAGFDKPLSFPDGLPR